MYLAKLSKLGAGILGHKLGQGAGVTGEGRIRKISRFKEIKDVLMRKGVKFALNSSKG